MGVSGNMAISSPLALVASLTIYPESKCTNDDDTEQGPAQLTNHEYRKQSVGVHHMSNLLFYSPDNLRSFNCHMSYSVHFIRLYQQ